MFPRMFRGKPDPKHLPACLVPSKDEAWKYVGVTLVPTDSPYFMGYRTGDQLTARNPFPTNPARGLWMMGRLDRYEDTTAPHRRQPLKPA